MSHCQFLYVILSHKYLTLFSLFSEMFEWWVLVLWPLATLHFLNSPCGEIYKDSSQKEQGVMKYVPGIPALERKKQEVTVRSLQPSSPVYVRVILDDSSPYLNKIKQNKANWRKTKASLRILHQFLFSLSLPLQFVPLWREQTWDSLEILMLKKSAYKVTLRLPTGIHDQQR